jgi:DNA mismatch repair protein MutS
VIERAKEILFNLEKQELDESGQPKIAYRSSARGARSQLLLFREDREQEVLREIRDRLEDADLSSLTPLAALNFLSELQKKLRTF